MIFENACGCIVDENVLEKAVIQECCMRGIAPKDRYKIYLYRGYAGISIKHDKVSIHRIIANYMIGQSLNSNISVHHINGNRLDNRISNLQILRKELHTKEHYLVQYVDKSKLIRNAAKATDAIKRYDVTEEKVLDLRKKGFTIPEIANELKCGYNTVRRRLGMKDN